MSGYYDDNFGHWDMDIDPEETREFYNEVQARSVWKICSICGEEVRLMPHYDKCNSCCDRLESGWQY